MSMAFGIDVYIRSCGSRRYVTENDLAIPDALVFRPVERFNPIRY